MQAHQIDLEASLVENVSAFGPWHHGALIQINIPQSAAVLSADPLRI